MSIRTALYGVIMGLTGPMLLAGCSWQPDQWASGWIQWSPTGEAIAIESHDDGLLVADRNGEVLANLDYELLPQVIDKGAGQPHYWYRWLWPDAESLGLARWTTFRDGPSRLDLWRVDLASGKVSEFAHHNFDVGTHIADQVIAISQPSEEAALRLVTRGSSEAGPACVYRIVDLPSEDVIATLEVDWGAELPVFDPRGSRLWWLASPHDDDWTRLVVMYSDISIGLGTIEGPYSCGRLPGGDPERFLLPQRDGSLKVRLLYWQGRVESGAVWRLVDVQCDPSAAEMHIIADRTFEGPGYTHVFMVNPAATEIAFFREKGELVVRSLVHGVERTAMFDNSSWLHINYGYYPVDGRALQPVWLDDQTVCTLWPSESVRDRLEVVLWSIAGETIVPHNLSEGWPEPLRPEQLEVRKVFNPTL